MPARRRRGSGRRLRPTGCPPGLLARAGREVRDQSPRRPALRRPSLSTWALAFNHDRPAFRGPGQIALKKAINFAIDRPAMVRPFGYLGGKRTDQMLPPALARPASIYPLGGADVVAARRWYARARVQAEQARVLHGGPSAARRGRGDPRVQPQADRHRPRGEVLLDLASLAEKAATPGEPFDLVILGWASRLCRRRVVHGAAPGPGPHQRGSQPRRPAPAAAHRCSEPPHR